MKSAVCSYPSVTHKTEPPSQTACVFLFREQSFRYVVKLAIVRMCLTHNTCHVRRRSRRQRLWTTITAIPFQLKLWWSRTPTFSSLSFCLWRQRVGRWTGRKLGTFSPELAWICQTKIPANSSGYNSMLQYSSVNDHWSHTSSVRPMKSYFSTMFRFARRKVCSSGGSLQMGSLPQK